MNGLLTDLYELTMAAGYVQAGKTGERATFEMFVRRLPPHRNFLVAAGLAQAVDYLLNLRVNEDEIAFVRGLPQFRGAPTEFFEYLAELRFTGDLYAVPEGTPVFAGEPLLTVQAPIVEAQIPETYLLAMVGFQTMIATKAFRVVEAACGRSVVEFGTRRAHSPEAGVLAGRAAFIGGCIGTSNVEAGRRFGIPVFGTAAHSWTMSFESELESFRALQRLLGPSTVFLIDSYDSIEGARKAASLGRPLWGVRLDSGDVYELSKSVREILNAAGLHDAKIMATGDLNEGKILELMAAGAPVDSFGVGTDLATSKDAPALGVVYKLVELESGGHKRYTAKFSADKHTMPGAKQIFRFPDHDEIGCAGEKERGSPLLRTVIRNGNLVESLPDAVAARDRASAAIAALPKTARSLFAAEKPYPVEYSAELKRLQKQVKRQLEEVPA